MGINIRIKQILLEIEYLLIITLLVSSISKTVMKYLDKYYICLLFVIYHELSHVFVGSLVGKKLRKVFLGICGMTAFFKYEYIEKKRGNYFKETAIFLAGPISNIIIATIFYKIKFVFEINIFLAFLNLIPIYPLDGYNALKAICSGIFFNKKEVINVIINKISIVFLILMSIFCIIIFYKYKNISGVIYLVYILMLNIKNSSKMG